MKEDKVRPGLDHPGRSKDIAFSSLCYRKPLEECEQGKDIIKFYFERLPLLLMETRKRPRGHG